MELIFDDEFTLADFKMAIMPEYERPLFPAVSNKTKTIPGRAGAWDFGVEIGSRVQTFPIVCLSANAFERERLLRSFTGKLFNRLGQPKEFKIRTSYEPELWISCRVSAAASSKYYRGGQADFELQITSFSDPYKRGFSSAFDSKSPVVYGEVKAGDYYKNYDSFQWLYAITYYGCFNYGSLETDVKFTLKNASGTEVSIVHRESGVTLTLPDFSNSTVTIDTKDKTVLLNNKDVVSGSNMRFFSLYPGKNSFEFRGNQVKGTVTSEWFHKFM